MKRFKIAGMMAIGIAVSIMFIMVGSLQAGGHIKRGGTLNYIFGSFVSETKTVKNFGSKLDQKHLIHWLQASQEVDREPGR